MATKHCFKILVIFNIGLCQQTHVTNEGCDACLGEEDFVLEAPEFMKIRMSDKEDECKKRNIIKNRQVNCNLLPMVRLDYFIHMT